MVRDFYNMDKLQVYPLSLSHFLESE